MKKLFVFSLVFVLFATFTNAQNQQQGSLDSGELTNQFDYLAKKSGNYRANGVRYEVIRLVDLNKIRQNVLDSIKTANEALVNLRATIAENETAINALNTKLADTTNNLNKLTAEKDSMSFFGAMVAKKTYKLIVWSIIIALLIFLIFFIYRFRNSNFLTQQAKSVLADVESEFEQHRRRALEREQKISRKLQDEINKNKKTV